MLKQIFATSLIAGALAAVTVYGAAHVLCRGSFDQAESAQTWVVALGLFAIPFTLSPVVIMSLQRDADVQIRTGAFTAAAFTTVVAAVAKFLTWRAMFDPGRGAPWPPLRSSPFR